MAKSQVLLRNRRQTLPLRPGNDVYVAGSNADNIGNQAGGWTLTWQGGSTNVIPGTTILDGIRAAVRGGKVIHSADASAPVPEDSVGVVVVGETPYAEGFGDVGGPPWSGDEGVPRPVKDMQLSAADRLAVDRVCAAAARCVVVVVSGRPLVIERAQLSEIDGLVAAWLPGSEGAGVADTLFGRRPFTGKLPVTWPRTLGAGADQRGRPRLRPALSVRLGAADALARALSEDDRDRERLGRAGVDAAVGDAAVVDRSHRHGRGAEGEQRGRVGQGAVGLNLRLGAEQARCCCW